MERTLFTLVDRYALARTMANVIRIDFRNNCVHLASGRICEIEHYLDENLDPCLPEEALSVSYVISGKILEYELNEDDLEYWE